MQNLPYDRTFDLHENEPIGGTHFDMNSLARRLVLIQRQKATWKCLLAYSENVVRLSVWHARESRATFLEISANEFLTTKRIELK